MCWGTLKTIWNEQKVEVRALKDQITYEESTKKLKLMLIND